MPHAETQDFVMMNATQFFILNLPEYKVFTQYLGEGSNYGYFLADLHRTFRINTGARYSTSRPTTRAN